MRKRISCLLIFIVLFLGVPKYVFAISQNIIYFVNSIEAFTNSDTIDVKGYSYISHKDNVGGRNLKTYLIAYVGDWKDSYKNCSNDPGDNCYLFKNRASGDDLAIDHFAARCVGDGCDESIYNKPNGPLGDSDACTGEPSKGSSCIYHNVGFHFKISLKYIYNYFGFEDGEMDGKSLKFQIYSKSGAIEDSTSFGATAIACRQDGRACKNGELKTKNYKITMNALSNRVFMDASGGVVRASNGDYGADEFKVWTHGQMVDILEVVPGMEWKQTNKRDVIIKDHLFKLNGHTTKSWAPDAIGPIESGYGFTTWLKVPLDMGLRFDKIEPDNITIECGNVDGFDADNYKNKKAAVCGGLKREYTQCVKTEKFSASYIYVESPSDTACSGYKYDVNGHENYRFLKMHVYTDLLINQKGTFYYPGLMSLDEKKTLTLTNDADEDKNVCYNNVRAGKGFTWYPSGEGNKATPEYDNTISWTNARYNGGGTDPYYIYRVINRSNTKSQARGLFDYAKKENGKCGAVEIDESSFNGRVYVCSKDNTKCKLVGRGMNAILEASKWAVDTRMQEKIDSDNFKKGMVIESCDSNSDSAGCEKVNVEKATWKEVKGDQESKEHTATIGEKSDKKSFKVDVHSQNTNFTYKLGYSYLRTWGDVAGTVVYELNALSEKGNDGYYTYGGNKYLDGGHNYYVSYKAIPGSYIPFSFKDGAKISLIPSIMDNWVLNSKCYMKVEDGLYECTGDNCPANSNADRVACNPPGPPTTVTLKTRYNYRPIDVKNPFPLGKNYLDKIANWKNWWNAGTKNQNRIKKAYDAYYTNKPLYEVSLKNSGAGSNISKINGLASDYNSWVNIKTNGSSKFVEKYVKSNGKSSYCPYGLYSEDCDVTWNG